VAEGGDFVTGDSQPGKGRNRRPNGRFPAIEEGLVRIFGRPWGGAREFMPPIQLPRDQADERTGESERKRKKA